MPQTTAATAPFQSFTARRTHPGPLVVAVGGSDPVGVLRAAQVLSKQSRAGVLAVSVLEPLPSYLGGTDTNDVSADSEEDRRVALSEQLWRQIAKTIGRHPMWSAQAAFGDAAHAIARLAYECAAPMIVMGLGRHRRLDRFLGLETTLRTVHRARCPVLAVSSPFEHPRRVVIATDFSATSARAAEAVLPLLDSAATITLVHAWQRISDNALVPDGVRFESNEAYAERAMTNFVRFAELLPVGAGMTVAHELLEGDPVSATLEYAEEHGADLIVAGRRGLGSLSRMLSHSFTAGIIRGANCSVLIAPEPQYADIDRLQLLLTGVSAAEHPNEWRVQLDNFTKRNAGRLTALEVDDALFGAQVQSSGYPLLGATYDPHDRQVELMLGDAHSPGSHITRGIGGVNSITVVCDAHGRDMGLRVGHGTGQTLLTFLQS